MEKFWYSNHGEGEEEGETLPDDVLEHDERALCLTRGMDRYVIPEDFVWDISKAVQFAMNGAQQAAPRA